MKRVFHILALLISSPLLLMAQGYTLKWKNVSTIPKGTKVTSLLGGDSLGYYYLRSGEASKRESVLVRNNMEHEEVFTANIPSSIAEKKVTLEKVFCIGKAVVLFLSAKDKKANASVLYAIKYDEQGKSSGEILLDECVGFKELEYSIQYYAEQQHILVARRESPEGENEKINFKMYDLQLQLSWQKYLDYSLGDFKITNFLVDEETNIFTVAMSGKSLCRLFRYDKALDKFTSSMVRIDKYGSPVNMNCFYKNKQVIFTGVYRGDGIGWLKGMYVIRINGESLMPELTHSSDFSQEAMQILYGNNAAEKNKGLRETFKPIYSFVSEDGSIGQLLEQQEDTRRDNNGNMNARKTFATQKTSLRFVVFSYISPKGVVAWSLTFPKTQDVFTFELRTVAAHYLADRLLLTYNSGMMSLGAAQTADGIQKTKGEGSEIEVLDIDLKTGLTKMREDMSGAENKEIKLDIEYCELAGDQLILYTNQGRNHKFCCVKMNE